MLKKRFTSLEKALERAGLVPVDSDNAGKDSYLALSLTDILSIETEFHPTKGSALIIRWHKRKT